jgi:hypothetical protein
VEQLRLVAEVARPRALLHERVKAEKSSRS